MAAHRQSSGAKRYYKVLRGRVEGLSGNQRSPLTSWARFDLGPTSVQIRGYLLLPPHLREGDEVIVAGAESGGRFEAMASVKIGESDAERSAHAQAQSRRRKLWIGAATALMALPLVVMLLFAGPSLKKAVAVAPLLAAPLAAASTRFAAYDRAALELELAMANDTVEST